MGKEWMRCLTQLVSSTSQLSNYRQMREIDQLIITRRCIRPVCGAQSRSELVDHVGGGVPHPLLHGCTKHTISFFWDAGEATWETSLRCLKHLGTMLSFGSASGEVLCTLRTNISLLLAWWCLSETFPAAIFSWNQICFAWQVIMSTLQRVPFSQVEAIPNSEQHLQTAHSIVRINFFCNLCASAGTSNQPELPHPQEPQAHETVCAFYD